MSNVTLNIALESRDFPAGTVGGAIRFAITKNDGSAEMPSQDVDGTSAVFDAIEAGSYTATAQRLDSNGNPLGDAVSTDFVVPSADAPSGDPAGTSAVDVPSSLTATVE